MIWGVAFAYHDNEYFVETAAGRSLPLMIWPDIGRYFPLQLREAYFSNRALLSISPGGTIGGVLLAVVDCTGQDQHVLARWRGSPTPLHQQHRNRFCRSNLSGAEHRVRDGIIRHRRAAL